MKNLAATFVLAALLGSRAWAGELLQDYSGLPPDLAAQARIFDAAKISGDAKMLDAVLADDFVLVNGGADVAGKAQFIKGYTDPDFKIMPFCVSDPVKKVWSDGAVLGGKMRMRFTDHGDPGISVFRYADIWVKRDGRWQVTYTQVTRLSKP